MPVPEANRIIRYVPALTGVRAIALVSVMTLHVLQYFPDAAPVMVYAANGYLGVDLFFILSGFINAHVYFSDLTKPSFGGTARYLWRRLVRIYPVHVAVIAIVILRHVRVGNLSGLPWQDLPNELLLIHAWQADSQLSWNAPSWSISAEWFAYLLCPLIVPAVAVVRNARLAFALAAVSLGVLYIVLDQTGTPINSWRGAPALLRVVAEFTCGIFLYRALTINEQKIFRYGDLLGLAGILFFVAGTWRGWRAEVFPFFLAMLVIGAATAQGPLGRLLSSPWVVWLGTISYSVYISHAVTFSLVMGRANLHGVTSTALIVTTSMIAAIMAGAALYYAVERPARNILGGLGAKR